MEEKRKKVVAFTAGRRGGNCEVYVKIALEAIRAMGIDVEMIRLHECELHPCTDCLRGGCYVKGPEGCIWKDDGPWLAEKFMESDGYILAAPVWSLSPCGIVTDFRDRVFGPKMDLAMWEINGGMPEWQKENASGRTYLRWGSGDGKLDFPWNGDTIHDHVFGADECGGQYERISGGRPRRSAHA